MLVSVMQILARRDSSTRTAPRAELPMDMQEPLCWAEAHHLADIRHWLEACKVAGGGEDVVIIDDTVPKVGSLKTSHFAALTTSRSGLSFKPSSAQGGEQLCCRLKSPSLLTCSTPDLKASLATHQAEDSGGATVSSGATLAKVGSFIALRLQHC